MNENSDPDEFSATPTAGSLILLRCQPCQCSGCSYPRQPARPWATQRPRRRGRNAAPRQLEGPFAARGVSRAARSLDSDKPAGQDCGERRSTAGLGHPPDRIPAATLFGRGSAAVGVGGRGGGVGSALGGTVTSESMGLVKSQYLQGRTASVTALRSVSRVGAPEANAADRRIPCRQRRTRERARPGPCPRLASSERPALGCGWRSWRTARRRWRNTTPQWGQAGANAREHWVC